MPACPPTAPVGTAGDPRIIPGTQTCKPGETAISWNQQGIQGPTGPTRPTGPTGPTGLAGVGSYASFYNTVNPVAIDPGSEIPFSANGPSTADFVHSPGSGGIQFATAGTFDITLTVEVSVATRF